MTARTTRWLLAGVVVLALVLVGVFLVRDDAEPSAGTPLPGAGSTTTTTPTPTPAATRSDGAFPGEEEEPRVKGKFEVAESVTREDSYYPDVGDPGVDSLHHDLDLSWDPDTSTLTGRDVLTFRATADADQFQLDLGEGLDVGDVTLDGAPVETTHEGKDLVVHAPVEEDRQYVVDIPYSGTPVPAPAPTTRQDFSTTGWTVTDTGEVWTMQEPYGAYTWYPVNDQPADKALYDFTISAPSPWVGIANGALTDRTEQDGRTVTTWHTDEPMSSYLTTIAIGDYALEEQQTASGTPISLWVPKDKPAAMEKVRFAREALEWVEGKLGPYPFSTAGVLVTDSQSGMETQTLITLGDNDYVLSKPVLVHEFVHQWYGDQTGPTDWRDVWMNEGMTMYLQAVWEAEHGGPSLDARMDEYCRGRRLRSGSSRGRPAPTTRTPSARSNIYYIPAVMWHELRTQIGDDAFWSMVRAWPSVHDNSGATREDYFDWVEETTGEELTAFFDEWINGTTTPERS